MWSAASGKRRSCCRSWLRLHPFRGAPLSLLALGYLFCASPARTQDVSERSADDVRAGIVLMQSHHFAAAEREFSKAIRLDSHGSDAMVWRGICENELQRYTAAASDFRAALRIAPDAAPAHYNLALSLIRLGDVDEAIHELEIVTTSDTGAVEAQYNLALLLEKRQRYAEAHDHLTAALAARPNDLGVAEHLLLDDLMLEKSVEADEMLQRLLADTTPPALQLQTGTELLALGFFPQAASLLESAHQRLPASRETGLLLARAYLGSQQDFKAIHLLAGTEASDPSGQTAYFLGLAYISVGASQEAAAAFRAALTAKPHDAGSLFQLGLLAERAGDGHRAEALADLLEAERLEPDNATYAMALGRLRHSAF
jgi:tetratricopeptide (TPR) repeat protein